MGPDRTRARLRAAARRGKDFALGSVQTRTAGWFVIGTLPAARHPEVGVPLLSCDVLEPLFREWKYEAGGPERAAFIDAHNVEIRSQYAKGAVVGLEERVMTLKAIDALIAKAGRRRAPGLTMDSPNGQYRVSCPKLLGPTFWVQLLPGTNKLPVQLETDDIDFAFCHDGETLAVREPECAWLLDLASGEHFSHHQRTRPATERATRIWGGAAKRAPSHAAANRFVKRGFEGSALQPGQTLEGVTLDRCQLANLRSGPAGDAIDAAPWTEGRTVVRNVALVRCSVSRSEACGTLFENVRVEHTRMNVVLRGCAFDRVTLVGHIGALRTYEPDWPPDTPEYRRLQAAHYARVAFALDISGVESGEVVLEDDIPVERLVLNPDVHFVMDRDSAQSDDFRAAESIEYTEIINLVWRFRRSGRQQLLIVANPKRRTYPYDIRALRWMRKKGFLRSPEASGS